MRHASGARRRISVVLRLVHVWLLVSSLYYIETLFSGEFVLDAEEGFTHKFAKYVVCAAFSAYFVWKSRDIGVAFYALLASMLLALHLGSGGSTNLYATTLFTIATMVGFGCLLNVYPRATRDIARTIVVSGSIVGVFSVIELVFLTETFVARWAATGGIRSISTMFNPNNLGRYLGAALLLIPWAGFTRRLNILLAIPICFGLIMSGSRTAWVAIALCALLLMASDNQAARSLRRTVWRYRMAVMVLLSLVIVALLAINSLLSETGIESENRGADLLTASIRWVNFLTYVNGIDFASLLPDTLDERAHLIQDSVYLVAFNVLGGGGVLVSITILATFARPQRQLTAFERSAWKLQLTYLLISGFSGTFINSFPNNQLFFIALGGLMAPRFTWGVPRVARACAHAGPASRPASHAPATDPLEPIR